MRRKSNKKGFTLLELLVVVLIIGILAAIALPQYQKAVGKAELAQVINLVKAVSNAQDVYYLTNNAYAKNFENIDVEVKDKNIKCYVSSGRWISCYTKNYALVHYYALDSLANQTECYATHEKFIKACEDFLKFNSTPNNNAVCDMLGVNPCFSVIKKISRFC